MIAKKLKQNSFKTVLKQFNNCFETVLFQFRFSFVSVSFQLRVHFNELKNWRCWCAWRVQER